MNRTQSDNGDDFARFSGQLGILSRLGACARRAVRRGRHRVLEEKGANLVEFALVSSVFFMVMIGLFQFTLVIYSYHFVSEAAREATRYAIVRGSYCTGLSDCNASNNKIQSFVQNLGYPGIDSSKLSTATSWYNVSWSTGTAVVTGPCGTPCNAPGNQVQVLVTYQMPLSFFWTNTSLSLTSTSAMVISQ